MPALRLRSTIVVALTATLTSALFIATPASADDSHLASAHEVTAAHITVPAVTAAAPQEETAPREEAVPSEAETEPGGDAQPVTPETDRESAALDDEGSIEVSTLSLTPPTDDPIEPAPAATAAFTPDSVCAGTSVRLHGEHWASGSYVISLGSALGGDRTVTVGTEGMLAATLEIPTSAPPGQYSTLQWTRTGDPATGVLPVTLTVRSCAPEPITSATPRISGTAIVGSTLTAAPGSWTPGTSFVYRWSADGVTIAGATTAKLTVPVSAAGKAIRVEVTGSRPGFTAATVSSAATVRVMRAATPVITGELAVGSVLKVTPGTWNSGTAFTYRWRVGGVQVATTPTLTLTTAHVGKRVSVEVVGSKAGHASANGSSANTLAVVQAARPTIAGTAVVGQKLTAAPGAWTSGSAFAYQWFADGSAIAGATERTFTVTTRQDGKAVTVQVTATKANHATVARVSAGTSRVLRAATPTISGVLGAGQVLTAKPGTWTASTSFTYQWLADGKKISGATSSTLRLTTALAGKKISVTVTGRKSSHASAVRTSATSARVLTTAKPSIVGTAVQGQTLTARPGTWTTGTSFAYQWYANGKAITGATRSTFTVTANQRTAALTVTVTGRKSGFATVAATSAATKRIPTTAAPTLSGAAKVGSSLTVRPGTWSAGTTFSYRWFVDGKAISGATGSSLTIAATHLGKRISVTITGRATGYTTTSRTSASTAAVTYPARTSPATVWDCPSWAPIKGNQSGIYHTPSSPWYSRTTPEVCFRTESAAVADGYRAPKR